MPQNRTTYVIIASTIALIALFFLQVSWMMESRDLIEEQFDQKVRMALCLAAETLDKDGVDQDSTIAEAGAMCGPVGISESGFQMSTRVPNEKEEVDAALAVALDFYEVTLPYELEILNGSCAPSQEGSPYCCSLSPFMVGCSDLMSINFPTKGEYIFGKMKFMLFSSIIILLFITLVFIFANHTLLRQKQVQQINKDFFNNMAHEFNTPLTNITLANKLLMKKHKNLEADKFVKVIQEESDKLKNQVERVLQLGNLENGEYELQKEPLQIDQLLQGVIKGMELQIQERNANIQLDISTTGLTVMGDKFHLGNAFRNIIDNALKYSKETPSINIRVEETKEGVLILFKDNGMGISKKEQTLVFDKYHRAANGDLHDQKGFGLGLSYVKMIVERHYGFVKVISDINKGCRFDLFIPRT